MSVRLAFALLLACVTACCATTPDPPDPHRHTLRLQMENGLCSATAVGPNVILTAKHCLTGSLVLLGGEPVRLLESRQIGPDMMLVTVDRTFDSWAQWSDRAPLQGESIYYWGNPSGLPDIYRIGYVAGFRGDAILADVEVGQGDSGAAVFDRSGRIVGIVSGYGLTGPFRLAIIVQRSA